MSEAEDRLWKAIGAQSDRVTAMQAEQGEPERRRNVPSLEQITEAVRVAMHEAVLTDDEIRYVRMAIQREAERAAFRKAVIEKTITGLLWMLVLGFLGIMYEWIKSHGWKP